MTNHWGTEADHKQSNGHWTSNDDFAGVGTRSHELAAGFHQLVRRRGATAGTVHERCRKSERTMYVS